MGTPMGLYIKNTRICVTMNVQILFNFSSYILFLYLLFLVVYNILGNTAKNVHATLSHKKEKDSAYKYFLPTPNILF